MTNEDTNPNKKYEIGKVEKLAAKLISKAEKGMYDYPSSLVLKGECPATYISVRKLWIVSDSRYAQQVVQMAALRKLTNVARKVLEKGRDNRSCFWAMHVAKNAYKALKVYEYGADNPTFDNQVDMFIQYAQSHLVEFGPIARFVDITKEDKAKNPYLEGCTSVPQDILQTNQQTLEAYDRVFETTYKHFQEKTQGEGK